MGISRSALSVSSLLLCLSVSAQDKKAKASDVVFREDFENFDRKRWDEFGRTPSAISIEDGGYGGGKCVEITARLGKDTGAHLYKMLEPGLDTCHLRFYVKFEKEHDYLHHFVHLVGYRPATRWPQGGAGVRPDGGKRFSTGIEPWGKWGRYPAPGAWHFYSYWCEMKRSRDGKYWGNSFAPKKPALVPRGRWICVEIMLRCNSDPEKADGAQTLWLDGKKVAHFEGIRWRTDPRLKVNGVWMLYYITENAARQNRVKEPRKVNRVRFDEIVVSRSYIGPKKKKKKKGKKKGGRR
jgi:hypothetical protein